MGELKTFTRWAAWERDVLAKVKDPEACQQMNLKRQAEIDDDEQEATLIASIFRQRLDQRRVDPDKEVVFIPTSTIAKWLEEDAGMKLPVTKVTPYLRALGIRELRYRRSHGTPGWEWRGLRAKPGNAKWLEGPIERTSKWCG